MTATTTPDRTMDTLNAQVTAALEVPNVDPLAHLLAAASEHTRLLGEYYRRRSANRINSTQRVIAAIQVTLWLEVCRKVVPTAVGQLLGEDLMALCTDLATLAAPSTHVSAPSALTSFRALRFLTATTTVPLSEMVAEIADIRNTMFFLLDCERKQSARYEVLEERVEDRLRLDRYLLRADALQDDRALSLWSVRCGPGGKPATLGRVVVERGPLAAMGYHANATPVRTLAAAYQEGRPVRLTLAYPDTRARRWFGDPAIAPERLPPHGRSFGDLVISPA